MSNEDETEDFLNTYRPLMNYEQFKHNINGKIKSIFLVDMTKEIDLYFSQLVQRWIEKYTLEGKKIWIIVNKKWYSAWFICKDCWTVPQCDHCSVSISYHKGDNWEEFWLCHICKKQYNLPSKCEKCWSANIKWFWIWTQKVAEYIKSNYWLESLVIESEKVNSPNKIKKTVEQVPDYKIFIWTSLLSTPIKDFELDLIIFLNADMWLNIPDYTSQEVNFNLLYDTFNHHSTSNFVVQSFNINQYSIRSACKLDKSEFLSFDNEFRKANNYPPFTDLCIILYKNEIEQRLFNSVDKLYKELLFLREKYDMKDLEIYSTPPLIYKKFGKYRYNIILKWKNLRDFMDVVFSKLSLASRWFKIDWQAESIV